jgi:ribosomal-protein-alanine N-acetyltransferase
MSGYADLPYIIEDMELHDVDEVMEIEHCSFSSPWSVRAYRYELAGNSCSHFLVVRQSLPGEGVAKDSPKSLNRFLRSSPRAVKSPVLGYGGSWLLVNDAHISTLAVAPGWRRLGLGELLVIGLLERAVRVNAEVATLEVRVSNLAAQGLYRKYHFQTAGTQRGYYRDNQEDALVMISPPLRSQAFQESLRQNRMALITSWNEGKRRCMSDRAAS